MEVPIHDDFMRIMMIPESVDLDEVVVACGTDKKT